MTPKPIHKREFHAFLSHAHADKAIVDHLYTWLSDQSGIPIWYDARHLPASTMIATYLPEGINKCRAVILILSKASVKSGWVQEEFNAAIGQRTQFKDFYADDVELLGVIHDLAFPYRRRILNYELSR